MAATTYVRVGVVTVALLAAAALLPMMGLSREDDREVRLVAIDKTFYLEGQSTPNPTLKLRAGERIRLVLRNEDDGMRHDLKIREWNVAVAPINGKGEGALTFRVPDSRAVVSYACTPHASSMQGVIQVE
jgi:plastocyanin